MRAKVLNNAMIATNDKVDILDSPVVENPSRKKNLAIFDAGVCCG